jgi:hypothetical protein
LGTEHLTPFEKGKSGNPTGRPKEDPEVKAIFRAHTKEAAAKLVHLMMNGKTETTQLKAATTILERGWGKPSQEITTPEDNPFAVMIVKTNVTYEEGDDG